MKCYPKIIIPAIVSVCFILILPNCRKSSIPAVTTANITVITATSAVSGGNVTNNGGADVTTRGICWNTSKNPSISSSKTTDGTGNGDFTSNLTGLTPNTTYYIRAYAANTEGAGYGNEISFSTIFKCGGDLTVNHSTADGAPIDKSVTYGTVETNLSGETKCWITKNLGATDQASSISDISEAAAGWYWQFNKKQGYSSDGTRVPNTTWIPSIDENSDWIEDRDPCHNLLGAGWRLPTRTEWENVDSKGAWSDKNGPYSSVLKIHPAGRLEISNGALIRNGGQGLYWSSTQATNVNAYLLDQVALACQVEPNLKTWGASVRCIKD